MLQTIESPNGSVGVFLKNMTNKVFYGVSVNGTVFAVCPETMPIAPNFKQLFAGTPTGSGLAISSFQFVSPNLGDFGIKIIDTVIYQEPTEGKPVYIKEMNMLVFQTYQELAFIKDKYGSFEKVVKAYAADELHLINGNYTVLTVLSDDNDFYTILDHMPIHLPKETPEAGIEIAKRHGIDPDAFKLNYVFLVTNVVRRSVDDKRLEHSHELTTVKLVPRQLRNRGEPIILADFGFIIFEGKQKAEEFLNDHFSLSRYLVSRALIQSEEVHRIELEELNALASEDKKSMLEAFTMMGGTTLISIMGENAIKYGTSLSRSKDGDIEAERTRKEAGSAMLTALVTCAITGVLYFMYKKVKDVTRKKKRDYREELKQAKEAAWGSADY